MSPHPSHSIRSSPAPSLSFTQSPQRQRQLQQQNQQEHQKDEDELLLDILSSINTSLTREQNYLCLELLNGTDCSPEAVCELINTLQQRHRHHHTNRVYGGTF